MHRKNVIRYDERGLKIRHKEWVTTPAQKPTEGIIVGIRTLSDGVVVWTGEEGGYDYRATKHLKAYLVVTDIYKNPLTVPFQG